MFNEINTYAFEIQNNLGIQSKYQNQYLAIINTISCRLLAFDLDPSVGVSTCFFLFMAFFLQIAYKTMITTLNNYN